MSSRPSKDTQGVNPVHISPMHKNAGFTLVEVLISLFIFSLISAGATTALTSSLRSQSQMELRLSEISQMDTLRGLIKADMSSTVLRKRRDIYGNIESYALSTTGEALLDFTRFGHTNPGGLEARGDLQRVSYLFDGERLIRRSYARAAPAPQTPYHDRVLIGGLARAAITALAYFESSGSAGSQVQLSELTLEAGEAPQLQQSQGMLTISAIQLELTFENGDVLTQLFELSL